LLASTFFFFSLMIGQLPSPTLEHQSFTTSKPNNKQNPHSESTGLCCHAKTSNSRR
jgi:hypothetical protein